MMKVSSFENLNNKIIKKSKYFIGKDVNFIEKEEINDLQEMIKYHSDLYYDKQSPIISDFEYDDLFKKLSILESKYNMLNKVSINVGAELNESTFEKIAHSVPMISLDNTYNDKDLYDFDDRVKKNIGEKSSKINYILEFKFDGLGVELIYKKGKLVQAITRGNGIQGEDVTQNIFQISNIPKKIDYKGLLEIRGEVVLPLSSFEKLNTEALKNGTKIFSNPRNAASGSLRMKDNRETKKRNLKFFAYNIANIGDFTLYNNEYFYYNIILKLQKIGFEVSPYFKKFDGIDSLIEDINNFGDTKKNIDFEIDGLVLKVNDIKLWELIGSTEHHPRYAIAYKFPAQLITTKILDIEHSLGRTGTITPVAILKPVNIGGVIVKRATLHNYEDLYKKDVKIGDNVFIKRAGEVIPEVVSVIKQTRDGTEKDIFIPTNCFVCDAKIKKDEDKVKYYCPNINCPDQIKYRLSYMVGKIGLNIDGFGEKQVELFLQKGLIKNIVDIFKLEEKKEKLLELEGFQEKSVNKLLKSIGNSKKQNISSFITALAISGVGKKTAKEISKLFNSKEDFYDFSYSIQKISSLKDIGPEIATNVFVYFSNPENKKIIKSLLEYIELEFVKKIEGKLSGYNLCVTGSFDIYKRNDIIKLIESNGGEFIGSVSKNLDYLIAGEKSGSKLKKAQDLGVKVISIDDFLNLI